MLVFLSYLPLFLLGLSFGAFPTLAACFVASVAAALFRGEVEGILFLGFIAVPVYYFVHRALLWRGDEREREWYPMLKILSGLTILASALLMTIAHMALAQGGLKTMVPKDFAENLINSNPDFATIIPRLPEEWSFVMYSNIYGLVWVIMPYALATLANVMLKSKNRALRPSLALEPRGMPGALLLLLVVSGGVVIAGQGADRCVAEAIFLLLLLPYFLCGLAFVHSGLAKRHMPMKKLWITCFYIIIFYAGWPVLAVIACGLYLHLAEILDRWKGIG